MFVVLLLAIVTVVAFIAATFVARRSLEQESKGAMLVVPIETRRRR
jgi:hypothetical protein